MACIATNKAKNKLRIITFTGNANNSQLIGPIAICNASPVRSNPPPIQKHSEYPKGLFHIRKNYTYKHCALSLPRYHHNASRPSCLLHETSLRLRFFDPFGYDGIDETLLISVELLHIQTDILLSFLLC